MRDEAFYDIANRLEKGADIWIEIGSGKFKGSVVKAIETKTHSIYKGQDYGYQNSSDGYGTPGGKYEDHKIKFKINGRFQWSSQYYLYEDEKRNARIVTATATLKEQNKKPPKDFLNREFNIDDVVFVYSASYGEMLGVVSEINNIGTITLRVAKRQHSEWMSDIAKQGIYKVPYERAHRVMIIDDPAILLLRA